MSLRRVQLRLRECAFAYADLGWRIFPMVETSDGRRKPIQNHSPYDATADKHKLDGWFLLCPWAQAIAVLCGAGSGMFGIDADAKDGKDGIKQLDELFKQHGTKWRDIVRSRTPSGGRHLFFQWDDRLAGVVNHSCLLTLPGTRNRYGRPQRREGLELKVRGTLLILPPSDFGNGRYRWVEGRSPFDIEVPEAPEWLIDLILNPPAVHRVASLRRRSRGRRDRRPDRRLAQDARDTLRRIAGLSIGEQRNGANRLVFGFAARQGRGAQKYAGDLVRAVLAMETDGRLGPWTQSQAERLVADALDAGSKRYGG